VGVVGVFGGEQRATEQGDQAGGDQAVADLGQPEMMAVVPRRRTAGWGRGNGQQVQEQLVAAVVLGQRVQLELAGRGMAVDEA
jgi:hypothetical protein